VQTGTIGAEQRWLTSYVTAKLIPGRTISGEIGPAVRGLAGLVEKQPGGGNEEIWH